MPIILRVTLSLLLCFAWTSHADEMTADAALVSLLQRRALPLASESDLGPLLERASQARLVLLGDATHGSYDFYRVRAHISQCLLRDKGFSFLAIEGSWEGTLAVDRYVRNLPGAPATAAAALRQLNDWPYWVWNNREMEGLVEWLRRFNLQRRPDRRVAIYGFDLLHFAASLEKLCRQPASAATARRLQDCLAPYRQDPLDYPRALAERGEDCAVAAAALGQIRRETGPSLTLEQEQRLRLVENAEAHYRAMTTSDAEAWNLRVSHFADTLERLLAQHGPQSRGIVWAHNTHIGDARPTAMADQGWQSLGEILRRRLGPQALFLIGSASYQGTVIASRQWGSTAELTLLPPAVVGSFAEIMHRTGLGVAYWLFEPTDQASGPLSLRRGQRAVGVVYDPEQDARDNYLDSLLPARYDALIFVDTTSALEPLGDD